MIAIRFSCASLLAFCLFLATSSFLRAAESVALKWNPNSETDLAGYRIYYGTSSAPFAQAMEVHTNSASVSNLVGGATYTFAVTAYNDAGAESTFSDQVSYTAPGGPLTLDNISSRVHVLTGENVMIGGFIVQSNSTKTVVLRAIGPSLSRAGVQGALTDPVLELHSDTGAIVASNDSWNASDGRQLSTLGLAPADPREAALVATLPAGAYSAVVRGKGSATGVALFELYNLDRTQGSVANISTRGRVETGDNVMIGGFIIGGADPTKVIVRAIGPSLVAAGIADALLDPTLELYNSDGVQIATNDNWRSDQQTAIQDSTVPPTNDHEAAIVATLQPGAYSAIVRGINGSVGVALVEVYALGK